MGGELLTRLLHTAGWQITWRMVDVRFAYCLTVAFDHLAFSSYMVSRSACGSASWGAEQQADGTAEAWCRSGIGVPFSIISHLGWHQYLRH